jgi:RNA polymerase subunit RPABC4/transcription elongation factor Spt4
MRSFVSATKKIIEILFNLLFGCRHFHTTFPQSIKWRQRRTRAAYLTGTYVVCLKCGKEFAYDWDEMRIVTNEEEFALANNALEAQSHSS